MTADLENESGSALALASGAYSVEGTHGLSNAPFTTTAAVMGGGSLPGTISNSASATLSGITLSAFIPCDTVTAELCLAVNVLTPPGTTEDCDQFIADSPLAVVVHRLTAIRAARGVVARWQTGTDASMLTFNLYRQSGAQRARVNGRLISPRASGRYSLVDRRASRTRALRYWLEVVDVDGSRTWHGPVPCRRQRGRIKRA